MKQIQCCIFDLDGVICDTAKYHFLAWKQLADKLGIAFTEADNERLKGVSRMESLEILLSLGEQEFSDQQKKEFADQKNAIYVDYISKIGPAEILPGVLDFFNYLQNKSVKIALGSVSKNAPMILERLGITDDFDVIADGNAVQKAKPNPDVFLYSAAALHINPKECVVFEDAAAGVEAAHNAGMFCVGLGDTGILRQADLVIPDFTGVMKDEILSRILR